MKFNSTPILIEKAGTVEACVPVLAAALSRAAVLAIRGLLAEGESGKQWYLERIIQGLGYDLALLKEDLAEQGLGWQPGMPPQIENEEQ